MTRLKEEWVISIGQEIDIYEKELRDKTGMGLLDLALFVQDRNREDSIEKLKGAQVAVVPVTAGAGVIGNFSQSVAGILRAMGADVFVTDQTDVAGIREAAQRGASILFMADDDAYIALNRRTGAFADNNKATAAGFVTVLEQMSGGLQNQEVLVMGYGTVGAMVAGILRDKGARVTVFDKGEDARARAESEGLMTFASADRIQSYNHILDATSEGGWIHPGQLSDTVWMASLGVPLSLDSEAAEMYKERVVYDYLEIGTAVMLGRVL
jgi:hypothetical protein